MILALLLVLGNAYGSQPYRQVDFIEVNHRHDEYGNSLSQVIFWQWSPDYRRFNPVGWDDISRVSEYPVKVGDLWVVKVNGRIVKSPMYRETWTNFDREKEVRVLNEKMNLRSILER